jgi:hypothetical protein
MLRGSDSGSGSDSDAFIEKAPTIPGALPRDNCGTGAEVHAAAEAEIWSEFEELQGLVCVFASAGGA